jgi:hypothetical protein
MVDEKGHSQFAAGAGDMVLEVCADIERGAVGVDEEGGESRRGDMSRVMNRLVTGCEGVRCSTYSCAGWVRWL